ILDDIRLYADDLPPAVLSSLIAQPLNQPIPSPFDTPVLLPVDLASNASSNSKSELALAAVRPNDPASVVPPRLTLSLDTASGQLLLQQVLDPASRPSDWTWEYSEDLVNWFQTPLPSLTTSASGDAVLRLLLTPSTNKTRFFRSQTH
ncbi:MAG: hypothetical protein IT581_23190, partial [Verrucomicrobiales bacterium]|nr:hypothetical protein [Verrucomicrobiales bacterium]